MLSMSRLTCLATLMAFVLALATTLPGVALAQESTADPSHPPVGEISVDEVMNQIQRSAGGSVRPPENAVTNAPASPGVQRVRDAVEGVSAAQAETPLRELGPNSDATIWAEARSGVPASVSIPDKRSAVLMQDWGMQWLEWRAKGGPLQLYGGLVLLGMIVLLTLFYMLRGRIRVEHGWSEETIQRFKPIERFGHWLLAGSFIVLALSGLNLLYGKDYLMPLIGKEAFASVTLAGKWAHNNMAWAFMLGLVLVLVMWIGHNIPNRTDVQWVAKAGGLFSKNSHPDADKFNFGQKMIFWGTILMGFSISLSGLSLLFPGELPMFDKTFGIANDLGWAGIFGWALPDVSAMQELQFSQIWHTIMAFGMIAMILAHIYIGTLGMEGAFDAMGTGQVDKNWAEEHHNLWVEKVEAEKGYSARTPAE